MPTITRALVTLSAVLLTAAPLAAQRQSDIITAEEIEQARSIVGTAYDAVQALRPQWLRSRDLRMTGRQEDPLERTRIHVYLNDIDQGDVSYLRTIPAEWVAELRFLSVNAAGSRFGPTDGPGIVVTLKE